ncbi:MAG: dipeptidase [Thermoanaerobaculia bacterium]
MKKSPLATAAGVALALMSAFAAGPLCAEDLKARAARLHRGAIVIDTHEDVPYRLEKEWVDIGARQKTGHVDIPRLRQGGVTGAFFADYVPAEYAEKGGSAKKALELAELIHRLVEAHPADLVFADSPVGVRAAKKAGKIAVSIGIEGGHAIENSLGALAAFYRLGVRYMTLTHNNSNGWADSSGSFFRPGFDPTKFAVHGGLNDLGRQIVLEMNRLGMLVDVSHVSDDTIRGVLAVSQAPVFASHSSCRALSNIPRNLTDEQIRAIAGKGGIVMINVSTLFLDSRALDEWKEKRAAIAPRLAELSQIWKADPVRRDKEVADLLATVKYAPAAWTAAVDHIERVLEIGGPQAAGLGTDFDGIEDPPAGLEDVSKLPLLTEELLRRGHSEEKVRGVLGENFLRFWERVEKARPGVAPRQGPLPFSKP